MVITVTHLMAFRRNGRARTWCDAVVDYGYYTSAKRLTDNIAESTCVDCNHAVLEWEHAADER